MKCFPVTQTRSVLEGSGVEYSKLASIGSISEKRESQLSLVSFSVEGGMNNEGRDRESSLLYIFRRVVDAARFGFVPIPMKIGVLPPTPALPFHLLGKTPQVIPSPSPLEKARSPSPTTTMGIFSLKCVGVGRLRAVLEIY